jgi:hypothetical protein
MFGESIEILALSSKSFGNLIIKFLTVSISTIILICSTTTAQAVTFDGGQNGVVILQQPINTSFIRVSGPNGFFVETESNFIQATDGLLMPDGQYSFELSGEVRTASDQDQVQSQVNTSQNNGRSGRDVNQLSNQTVVKVLETGYFRILNGEVIIENAEGESNER